MPSKPEHCWLVIRYMHEIGHPLAWQPIAVYNNKQRAQDKAEALGEVNGPDGISRPIGRIEMLPLTLGEK